MSERIYKWDVDHLETCRKRLRLEKENLEKNKIVVENLRTDIMKNWQSFSSEIYLDHLETDIENLEFIIQAAGELEELLGKVITDAYRECENTLQRKLQSLVSLIGEL